MERVIETPRLLLRPFAEGDAADVYAYCSDPRVGPPAGWPPHRDEADSLRVIREIFQPAHSLAVVLRETGRVVGCAGFVDRHQPGLGEPSEEVGYSLSPACWGRGLIPEAVRAILDDAFRNRRYAAVWACYYDGNRKSRRVMEKCGMTWRFSRVDDLDQVGESRLSHYYAVTRGEWGL